MELIGNKPKSPCDRKCSEREMRCHSKCEKYIEWKRADTERKKAIETKKRRIAEVDEYRISRIQEMKARKGKK